MALVNSCFCCSLMLASGFFGLYLLIAYLIAFAFELLWILESSVALPAAAVLLCAGFFTMALFAALLTHGLATKNPMCLVAWMFSVTVLTFPEAGLVIYMSVHYWRIETLYGITELSSWTARILVNLIELVLIQSLYSSWKDEEMIEKRLQSLDSSAMPIPLESLPSQPLNSRWYRNNAYHHSIDNLTGFKKPPMLLPAMPNNFCQVNMSGYELTRSEFNASVFLPSFVENGVTNKRTQSLLDLRYLDDGHKEPISYTESVDSQAPKLKKCASLDALDAKSGDSDNVIRNRTGFYARPLPDYGVPIYYGPLDGPDFLIYRKQIDRLTLSKNSLSNASADDVQKYRDVAL